MRAILKKTRVSGYRKRENRERTEEEAEGFASERASERAEKTQVHARHFFS
jgi:hypothetical protein